MRGELMRVDRIVEGFLLSSKTNEPFKDEDLGILIDEVVMLLRERAESSGIRIIQKIGQGTVLRCQRERIKQVFFQPLKLN
jgi:signal transduction histidine kinase